MKKSWRKLHQKCKIVGNVYTHQLNLKVYFCLIPGLLSKSLMIMRRLYNKLYLETSFFLENWWSTNLQLVNPRKILRISFWTFVDVFAGQLRSEKRKAEVDNYETIKKFRSDSNEALKEKDRKIHSLTERHKILQNTVKQKSELIHILTQNNCKIVKDSIPNKGILKN